MNASANGTKIPASLIRFARLRAWYVGLFTANGHVAFFAVFYILLTTNAARSPSESLVAIAWVWVYQAYMFLVNDLFDLPFDKIAGKENALERFSRRTVVVTLTLLISAGFSIFLLRKSQSLAVLVLSAYFLATAYSAPPFRLKTRGVWGFVADSIMEKPLPVLIIFAFLNEINTDAIVFALLSETLQLMTVLKQQIDDYEGDLASGVHTFAIQLGRSRSDFLLRAIFYPMNMFSIAVFSVFVGSKIDSAPGSLSFAWTIMVVTAVLLFASRRVNEDIFAATVTRFTKLAGTWYNSKNLPFVVSFTNVHFEGLVTLVLGLKTASMYILNFPVLVVYLVSQYYYGGFYKVLLLHFSAVLRDYRSGRRISDQGDQVAKC